MVAEVKEQQKKRAVAEHVRWHDLPVEALNSMLDRQYVVGQQMMVARMVLRKGCLVPQHSHENEQVSYIESGALEFAVEGKTVVVRAGEVLVIPPNVPHSATALEDTVGIDLFTPPRQDWLEKRDNYLRG